MLIGRSMPPDAANTAAVVVLFHPPAGLHARLARVQAQVAKLVVVSNDQGPRDRLAGSDTAKLLYLSMPSNVGLAAALNAGLQRAAGDGFRWCLLLDQDTVIDADLVQRLADVYASYPEPACIGILAPNYRSSVNGRLAYRGNVGWSEQPAVVTSGSLVNLLALGEVGSMREDFFIEGIDTEFCLRLRAAGWKIVASGPSVMLHGAGETEERKLLGRTVLVSHHAAWRCHLQFRNLLWTMARWGGSDWRWMASSLAAIFKRLVLVMLFEQERPAKLRAMASGAAQGLWHGVWRSAMPAIRFSANPTDRGGT